MYINIWVYACLLTQIEKHTHTHTHTHTHIHGHIIYIYIYISCIYIIYINIGNIKEVSKVKCRKLGQTWSKIDKEQEKFYKTKKNELFKKN